MPETAAGRAPLVLNLGGDISKEDFERLMAHIRAREAEARALGRAEALAAVRAVKRYTFDEDEGEGWYESAQGDWVQWDDIAAIDNLETPDPELDAYAAGFNPARHADGEEL